MLKGAARARSQCLTALAALQNFTRHNPRIRGSISFFIKYIGPFHKLLLLVHLATHSFYELLKLLDHLEKNHNDVLATANNPLCLPGLGHCVPAHRAAGFQPLQGNMQRLFNPVLLTACKILESYSGDKSPKPRCLYAFHFRPKSILGSKQAVNTGIFFF